MAQNLTQMLRGGMYIGTYAAPGVDAYMKKTAAGQDPLTAAANVAKNYAGFRDDGTFHIEKIVEMAGPGMAWTALDTIASRFGVWRKMSRAVNSIMG